MKNLPVGLTIAVCLACFWAGAACIPVKVFHLPPALIPAAFTVVLLLALLYLALLCRSQETRQ